MSDTTDVILDNYGGTDTNSLKYLLESQFTEQADINDVPELLAASPYYDNEQLLTLLSNKQKHLKLLSLNCQSLNAKHEQLNVYLNSLLQNAFDIVCLQETWLSESSNTQLLQIDGYQMINQNYSVSSHGGLTIYLKNKFKYKILDMQNIFCNLSDNINSTIPNTCESLFIEVTTPSKHIKGKDKKLIIGNIYRPPRDINENYMAFVNELNLILDYLNKQNKEIVITGDFNIDLLKVNEKTVFKEYIETFMTNGLIPRIIYPTRFSERRGTLIDNVFCKLNDPCLGSAGILLQNISDHNPYFFIFNLHMNDVKNDNYITKRYINTNCLNKLKNDLEIANVSELLRSDVSDPNINYDILEGILLKLMEKHMPLKAVKFNKHKHKKSPWITYGIIKSIKKRDKLYASLKSIPSNSPDYNVKKINLKTFNSILRKSIKLAKKTYYYSTLEKNKQDMKQTWNVIKDLLNRNTNTERIELKINNQIIDDQLEVASELNKHFIKIADSLTKKIKQPQNKSFNDYLTDNIPHSFEFKPITESMTKKVINNIKTKSSCGVDGLSSYVLKYIKDEISGPLTLIINQSLKYGVFPEKLKIAKVTPIYKGNDSSHPQNYRPISILPTISKVFEKLMHQQINNYFTSHNLLNNKQYGFRDKHSTEFSAIELVDKILHQLDVGNAPLNIYLDLSKAFDTIDHVILLQKLQFYGFTECSIKLIHSYLNNRKQCVEINSIKSEFLTIVKGVPQGSILGPLLFLIYMNDFPKASSHFDFILYADDTTLFTSLNKSDILSQSIANEKCMVINKELNSINDWLCLNKLLINVQKSKYTLFSKNCNQNSANLKLKIDENEILHVDTFSFLGITLDKRMSFKTHVMKVWSKISKIIGILNKMKHIIPRYSLLTIYNSLIMPQFTYGILIWGHQIYQLQKLQKRAIRIICNEKYNAHTDRLFKELNLLKVQDLHKVNELKLYFKLQNNLVPEYTKSIFTPISQIHSHNTRRHDLLYTPRAKHTFAKQCVRYSLPTTIKHIPGYIISKITTHSQQSIVTRFTTFCIEKYQNVCTIQNCYVCRNI